MGRRRTVLVVALLLALVASVVTVALLRTRTGCGEQVRSLPATEAESPFLSREQRQQQADPDRDALVRELGSDGPFAEVLGAVGYHYEQWAQLSAFAGGLGVRTRHNPDFTMLSEDDLRPLWSAHVTAKQSAYDADDRTYLVAPFGGDRPTPLVALDVDSGERQWCSELEATVRPSDAFATQFLDDGDIAVLYGPPQHQRIARLEARSGRAQWSRSVRAGDGDFLGSLGNGIVLAGGTPQFELLDDTLLADRQPGRAVVALDAATGRERWHQDSAAGTGVHILGTDPGTGVAALVEWSASDASGRLFGVDRSGSEIWSTVPMDGARFDATLRTGRVLVRSGADWAAYDAASGERLWHRRMPSGPREPQLLPYGFELHSLPLLDDDHALLGTTTALQVLDLRDGSLGERAPLPTDGINTTYWPYQVVVTDRLVAVATNTGAVVLRRRR